MRSTLLTIGLSIIGMLVLLATILVSSTVFADSLDEMTSIVTMPIVLTLGATDDFSDPSSGWPIGIVGDANHFYTSTGEYGVSNRVGDTTVWVSLGHMADNFELSIDARASGVGTGAYGLFFGADNSISPSSAETVGILPIFNVAEGTPIWGYYGFNSLIGSTQIVQDESSVLNDEYEMNHIKIIRENSELTIILNDVPVYSGTHAAANLNGTLGMFVYGNIQGFVAVFDNYEFVPR